MFKRRHHKFTNKTVSKRGISSVILFLAAAALLGYGIYLSFRAHGDGDTMVGILGAGGLVSATAGLFLGLNSIKDENVFHTFAWVGSVGNAIIWFFILCLIMVGI